MSGRRQQTRQGLIVLPAKDHADKVRSSLGTMLKRSAAIMDVKWMLDRGSLLAGVQCGSLPPTI